MSKRSDLVLQRANYALEEWAQWVLSSNGYPPTSAIEHIDRPTSSDTEARIPHGVEFPSKEVANVIYVFHKMIEAGDKSAENCQILRVVALGRKENESLAAFCKRLEAFSPRKYHYAVEEFAARLDMI